MTTIRKCESTFVETDIDDEKVVMSLETGEFFSLKETALEIWNLLDQASGRDRLLDLLASAYGMAPDMLGADLDLFLSDLAKAGLIERG